MGRTHQPSTVNGTPSYTSNHGPPAMPPPPYFKTYLVNPSSFKAAINTKLDNPAVSLFRLTIRLLQFAFALASGISYAIELHHGTLSTKTNFIYAEVVFVLTLLTLAIDSVTVRYYRFIWAIEWALAVLWVACFGVFYQIHKDGEVKDGTLLGDSGRMKRAVWCNLANALLWLGSALFSSTMCCAGIKAALRAKLERRRRKKEEMKKKKKGAMELMGEMENGVIGNAMDAAR